MDGTETKGPERNSGEQKVRGGKKKEDREQKVELRVLPHNVDAPARARALDFQLPSPTKEQLSQHVSQTKPCYLANVSIFFCCCF